MPTTYSIYRRIRDQQPTCVRRAMEADAAARERDARAAGGSEHEVYWIVEEAVTQEEQTA